MTNEERRQWANSCVARYKAEQNKPAPSPYKLLGTFKSASSTSSFCVHSFGGRLSCTCPGFTFRKKCKHLDLFAECDII